MTCQTNEDDDEMSELTKHIHMQWRREEIYWHRRARIKWLKHLIETVNVSI